jgi:2'-5' RNA ligase
MRAFIALLPPPEVIDHLDTFLEVRRPAAPLRWTDPEFFHVTLAFAAKLPESALDELYERLERFCSRREGFRTRIKGGGAFPNVAEAKVLWADLELTDADRQRMGRLSHDIRQVANKAGVPVAGGGFRPHVTVARTRPIEASNWVRLLDEYSGPDWDATEVGLIESRLGEGPGGRSKYAVLERFALRQR